MMRKAAIGLALAWALLLACGGALAQTAEEITAQCSLRDAGGRALACLSDGRYDTSWSAYGKEARLVLNSQEAPIHGVYLQFYNYACPFEVQARDAQGKWQRIAACDTEYLTGYAAWPEGATEIRIRPTRSSDRLALAEVHLFGKGEMPDWVQRWQPPLEKADLLVVAAHPDDELLFMGGTIPYYAGERGMAVQTAYLVPATPYRKLELLDGLWLCGAVHYPDIGTFPDRFALSVSGMYAQEGWSEARVLRHMVGLYRRYQPDVVVTHDVQGEYGHGAHRAAADAAQKAVALAADAAYQHRSLSQTPPWTVKKLYLHLYDQGEIRMDWRVPLEAFGGRTAFDMAEAAFACHISQQDTEYCVEDFGPYDNARFGLAWTTVGEDCEKNDFFEHTDGNSQICE